MHPHRHSAQALVILLTVLAIANPANAAVTWTGAGGPSWATSTSWSPSGGPNTTDTVIFNDTGASPLPADPTSVLNANRTIGTLSFSNTSTKFHTLDLATRTLTISGNLNFNQDQSQNTLTTIRNGTLTISGAFANINAGRAVTGTSNGVADLSGLTALNATVQDIQVGASAANSANGTLTLSPLNAITAQRVLVGYSTNSGDTHGTLHLGLANTFNANEFDIGKDNADAIVDIANGGSLTLGTAAQRPLLQVGVQNITNNGNYTGKLDLTGGTLNARVGTLIVGQKQGGGFGDAIGSLVAGDAGSIDIGAPGNTANFYVGRKLTGGNDSGAVGDVDFSGLATLTASLNTFSIGTATTGTAQGSVKLAAANTISALNIIVGSSGDGTNTLALGTTNTITANVFAIGQNYAHGTVTIRPGGTLNLGAAAQRTSLSIGAGNTTTNTDYTGKLDLTGATLNAFLSDLIVGQKEGGGFGDAIGSFVGAGAGSIDIGAPGNTASFLVGRKLTGGSDSGAIGNVDFSGLATLNANVSTLAVGTALSGHAQGTLKLAATNTINASTITVGANAYTANTLALGRTNTILTNQLTIGQDNADASVTIASGGSLTLGSPTQRTSISINTGATTTPDSHSGTLDLTNATLTAYLDNVIIGNKNTSINRTENATFTISTRPDNRVEANAITIAGNQATGTLNYGGGQLFAGTIARGTGTAAFNWTGGQLSVGTFGTPTLPFNLANTGTGTLAPGSAANPVGTTIVNGNYTQGPAASTAIDIAGISTGAGNDQLNVTGSATLAGSLSLKLLNGFTPALGQSFLIANYASRTGTFAFVAPPHLPQDVAFQMDYTTIPTQLNVRMVAPTNANWLPATSTGTWATPANWDTAATPGTTSNVTVANTTAVAKTLTVSNSTTVHRISLQGTNAPVTLDVPQGVQLGVANQLVVGPNATLTGAGQILGDVVVTAPGAPVSAVFSPGAPTGALAVSGDLTQTATGTTKVTLATGNYSRANISGTATLAGAIQVAISGGFAPSPLQSFQVLTFGSHNGHFTSYQNLDLPGPLTLAPVYSATDLRLVAVLPGDADANGTVDFTDLVALAQSYNTSVANADGWWRLGDFTLDGQVDFNDLVQLAQNYNTAVPAGAAGFEADLARAFATVPEPGSISVIGMLLYGLIRRNPRIRPSPHQHIIGKSLSIGEARR